jgi:hypothetical protein
MSREGNRETRVDGIGVVGVVSEDITIFVELANDNKESGFSII